jgi:hypothetical protein
MHTRPCRRARPFCRAAGIPDHRREVEHYLKSGFAASSMREQQGDRPLGRIALASEAPTRSQTPWQSMPGLTHREHKQLPIKLTC